ncbi:DinB family protein [Oscillatoria amoena NRMC-F 0135]|nr:DinB family protein [Oscillatoria amoena NRMC-F 0135]
MKAYFQRLYRYNEWANNRVLNGLKSQHVSDQKVLEIMGHVVAAQLLWLHRVKHLPPPPVKLWGEYGLEELIVLSDRACKEWLQLVEERDNFSEELSYSNYRGESYTNNVETIMIHLVNHSSYHRAQVALLLRQKGYEPVNTDFITYDRILRGQWKE